ncbi:MAG: GAF domain-containing protein [Variovorax sp.]|nr:MAG: GAF domain-containing protein [Variovorax sp.]
MPNATSPTLADQLARLLNALPDARSADTALRLVDACRRQIAGDSIFSIQQNVTTAHDPIDEIRLSRFYSSEADRYPVKGVKLKSLAPWTECLFVQGRVFVGEGAQALTLHFDDFEQMDAQGLQSVINVPLLQGNLCYATFNVFGTRARWLPHEVLGIRLLALAAARWVPVAPGLAQRFAGASLSNPVEV